jgi:hypothetical protein
MKNNQKGFAQFTIFIIGFTIVVGIWFVWSNYLNEQNQEPSVAPVVVSKKTVPPQNTKINSGADNIITTAIKPKILSRQFGSDAIFSAKADFSSLRNCSGAAAVDCQIAALQKISANNNALEFYRQSDWGIMSAYTDYNSYSLVDVFSPLAANSNHQYAFLSGKNLWYLMDTDFNKVSSKNIFTEEFPSGREISFSNGEFIGPNKKGEIVFNFDITTGCRSCGTGYRAAIGYSVDAKAGKVAARLLTICSQPDSPDDHSPMCSSDAILNF